MRYRVRFESNKSLSVCSARYGSAGQILCNADEHRLSFACHQKQKKCLMESTSPLTALVEFEVRKETTSVETWLEVWRKRGQDALEGEPETTAYEALRASEAAENILIFERYQYGQKSIDAHIARPAHASLMAEMGEARMTKRNVMSHVFCDIPDYGWWSRPDRNQTMSDRDILMTLLVTRFPNEKARADYVKLTGDHADYCRDAEPDTLIYSGGLAQSDANRGPGIKAGDLLFVAAFADEAAAEKHRIDPVHLALQPKLQEIPRERVMVQQYLTTGSGFLWTER